MFWKNMLIGMVQIMFMFFSGFKSTNVLNDVHLAVYNLITVPHILATALFNKDVKDLINMKGEKKLL